LVVVLPEWTLYSLLGRRHLKVVYIPGGELCRR
jgi:hypothetical protein